MVVGIVAVLVFGVLQIQGDEANLAGVWLILVTMPGSMRALPFADPQPGLLDNAIFYGSLVVGVLINTAL